MKKVTTRPRIFGAFFLPVLLLFAGTSSPALSQSTSATENLQLVPQTGMEQVVSVAFSKNGALVLVGSRDGKAVLWEVQSGRQIRSFSQSDALRSACFSPDGKVVMTGGDGGIVTLWNVETGQEIRHFKAHFVSVISLAFSPDGRRIVTGSLDHNAKIWNADTGEMLQVIQGQNEIYAVAFSPDGHAVLTGGADHAATLWDSETGAKLKNFAGHSNSVTSVAFSSDAKQVLTGSLDHTARLWDTNTGNQVRVFTGHTDNVLSVAFSPKSGKILTGSNDKTAKLWNAETGALLQTYKGHTWTVMSVAFSPTGEQVLTGSSDQTAVLWDAATAKKVFALTGYSAGVTSVAVSADGSRLLLGNDDKSASVWDTRSGQPALKLTGSEREVLSTAFSSDGKRALTGSYDAATLWDVEAGTALRSFAGETNWMKSVAFTPDGKYVVAQTYKAAELWDASTGAHVRSFTGHTAEVTHIAISADGKRILTGGEDRTTKVWDVESGKMIRSFDVRSDSGAFSPDGRYVFLGESPGAELWDVETGVLVRGFRGHTWKVVSVAFSKDGGQVLTGSWDHTAKLWDVATGKEIRSFEGHTNMVTGAAFSVDGRYAITTSEDTTSRVWDVATGKLLAVFMNFRDGGWAVVDSEGRFDTNDLDGGARLSWVVSSEPFRALPLEIFMRDYYTPGLLARVMKGEKLPTVRSIAEIKNRLQPEVKVLSVEPSEKTPGRVDVVVHGASRVDEKGMKSGLQDLRVFRDGQLVVDGYRDGTLKDGDFVFRDVMLKSDARKAVFTAYAFSAERIKSATASLEYEPKTQVTATAVKPRAFLLQVGVNQTLAKNCELHYSVADAETMSAVMSERLKERGFDVVAVKLESELGSNAQGARKDMIRADLATIAKEATPDDAFFMSFSGHGYSKVGGAFYVLPSSLTGDCHNQDEASLERLLSSALSADELAEWLRPIDAGEMTLILDACYSAESIQAGDFKPGPMGSRGLGQVAYDKRMRVLAASQSDAVAHEYDRLGQGLLTYVLAKDGLERGNADWRPIDKKITVGEWLDYAAKAVPQFKPETVNAGASKSVSVTEEEKRGPAGSFSGQTPALFDFSQKDTFILVGTPLSH